MMRVAIVGGLGFVGLELAKYLVAKGHVVDVYDMVAYTNSDNNLFNYYKLDLLCSDYNYEHLERTDAMVVLAAKRPYSGFSFADLENNIRISERCFSLALSSGINNVIFASSKAVYSDTTAMPWKEIMCPTPASLYGVSKVASEQLAFYYSETYKMKIKCLRFAQIIGFGERKGYLINTLIDNALRKKRQIVYGDGSQRRQYIYIKDICRAIFAALEHPNVQGVFNIAMPGTISNYELAESVNEAFDNKGNLFCDYDKPMSINCDEMDVSKARDILGFDSEYNIRNLFKDLARQLL